jgi:sRNA-binding carbon storage regulator CsrA
MLVLSFRPGDKAVIQFPDGDEGVVMVTSCSRTGNVRIGFDMPEDINIVRESVLDRVKALEGSHVA